MLVLRLGVGAIGKGEEMIMESALPPEAMDDPFKPPAEPVTVCCLHCGQEYSSDLIVWRIGPTGQGFWCCGTEGCDGAGFSFDIFPLDSGMFDDDEGGAASDD